MVQKKPVKIIKTMIKSVVCFLRIFTNSCYLDFLETLEKTYEICQAKESDKAFDLPNVNSKILLFLSPN